MRAALVLLALWSSGCCCFGGATSLCAEACVASGACQLRTERTGDALYRCYAGSDADCAGSALCRDQGRCYAAEDGECVVASEVASRACAVSPMCTMWGGCHPREGFCEPRTVEDCLASVECRTQGRCELDSGDCVVGPSSCSMTSGCELEGTCTYTPGPFGIGGTCALTAEGSCAATLACTRDGRCAPRPMEGCSEGCRVFFCARPESLTAPVPCAAGLGVTHPACAPDGRCMANAAGECEHIP